MLISTENLYIYYSGGQTPVRTLGLLNLAKLTGVGVGWKGGLQLDHGKAVFLPKKALWNQLVGLQARLVKTQLHLLLNHQLHQLKLFRQMGRDPQRPGDCLTRLLRNYLPNPTLKMNLQRLKQGRRSLSTKWTQHLKDKSLSFSCLWREVDDKAILWLRGVFYVTLFIWSGVKLLWFAMDYRIKGDWVGELLNLLVVHIYIFLLLGYVYAFCDRIHS